MNDNILCIYYSRTGNTKKAMEEVAEALDCECLEIRDKVDRSGTMGYLRCPCGRAAVRALFAAF